MNAHCIDLKQREIDFRVTSIASGVECEAICDGIISPAHYISTSPKFLWLGREPSDDGGGYDYKVDIVGKLERGERLKGRRYFDPMRYILHSAQNGHIERDAVPDSDFDLDVSRLLLNIAFVNCSKIPGGSSRDIPRWWSRVELFREVVFEQIALANPDVIICVGTRDFLEKFGYLDGVSLHPKSYRNYYQKGNQLIFDCFHIAYRRYNPEAYFNDIVDVLRMKQGEQDGGGQPATRPESE
jgi:hypothetical protein